MKESESQESERFYFLPIPLRLRRKLDWWSLKQKRKNKLVTILAVYFDASEIEHCDWFALPLMLKIPQSSFYWIISDGVMTEIGNVLHYDSITILVSKFINFHEFTTVSDLFLQAIKDSILERERKCRNEHRCTLITS